jgi:hypothetical protein
MDLIMIIVMLTNFNEHTSSGIVVIAAVAATASRS